MAGTNDFLRAKGVEIVARMQPCRPNDFLKILRTQYGASHRAANETMFTLIRDGFVKTNFTGKLVLHR